MKLIYVVSPFLIVIDEDPHTFLFLLSVKHPSYFNKKFDEKSLLPDFESIPVSITGELSLEKNNESEDSEINSLLSNSDEGIVDKKELFNKLYKRIMERFKFKDDITLIEQISEKLNDDSLRLKEKLDLTYVLNYMNDVE